MLVRPAEFALIKGVARQTVSTAMKDRIKAAVVERDGVRMLDRDLALELWDRNTLRNNNAKVGPSRPRSQPARTADAPEPPRVLPRPRNAGDELLAELIMGIPEDAIPGVDVSRERREHYQAEKARLEALQGRNELVPVAAVRKAAQELGQALRDNVMGVPNRIAGMLAATTDAGEVTRLLEEELRVALRVMEGSNA
jgi:hypothetical protein